jgi:CheY-like chemotaxis protein
LDQLKAYAQAQALPNLIFLDLNMPILDGKDTLSALKADDELKHIPVVLLSTSNTVHDTNDCYLRGAAGYFAKPASFDQLVELMKSICDYWYKYANLPSPE